MSGALPLLYAAALWFAGTGLVLWLDRRARGRTNAGLAALSLAAAGALWALWATAGDTGAAAAYVAFTAALIVWGWHELAFLAGHLTGPNRAPLPAGATGLRRFRLAALTLIWHELALAGTAALIVALTWGQPNQTGTLAFAILLAMRLSAKLNIFAGVPHFADELLPARLGYLRSYFRTRPAGLAFAASLGLCLGLVTALGRAAFAAPEPTGLMLLAGLALLGLVEHLFLVTPWRDAALWRWANPQQSTNKGCGSAHPAILAGGE